MPIIEGAMGVPLQNAAAPTAGVNEIQVLTYTATTGTAVADSGTFKIAYEGFTTTALAFNASAAAVEAALVALPSIGAAGCTVVLTAGPPRLYTVTFGGGNMLSRALPPMTTITSLLQGANVVNVVVTESQAGVSASGLGAPKGALLMDTSAGVLYTNTGTALAPVWTNAGVPLNADGLGVLGVARFTFDAGVAANRTVAAHGTGVTLPAHAIVVGGFFDVNTLFTSANANNGTIAISVEAAGDIQVAAAVSGAPYSSINRKAIVPKANTPESTSVKTTVAREITCTVAVSALLTGKLTGFLYYVMSGASA